MASFSVSGAASDLQRRHLMHCWGVQGTYDPIPVERTEGCWIYTTDGRRIFDLRSAHECINLGFRHPKVLAAMRAQMESVVYVTDDFATAPTARLAQRLAELAPGGPNKRVWFGQSGAAAIEAAIKGARQYQYRRMIERGVANLDPARQYPYPYKIITRYRSWHGATAGAASAGGDPRRWFQEPAVMPGVKHGPEVYCYRCPLHQTYPSCDLACAAYIDRMIELEGGADKVAAVLIEPVVGSNGILVPPPGYLPRLREICDRWGVLLIADETMTGMGRTGKLFAIEHWDVEPDILVMGKALGAYCPLSATIFSEKVASAFDDMVFGHGQSYAGHALACAAGLASLEVLEEENLLARTADLGAYLGRRLHALAEHHPSVGEVRGLGLFWTLELVRDRSTKAPFRRPTEKYAPSPVRAVARYLLDWHNIYVPADKFGLWIVPPLVVTRAELDAVVEALDDALHLADAETEAGGHCGE
ncbi:MAG: aspartate aminotransferase family protein [Bacteroidetes bacterium]|nr:MAG: aspartate aminotransferase family protein [Bacteroidota bacterium]